MDINKKLYEAREMLIDICNRVDEDSPYYNYIMNGLMFVDEATRVANGEVRLANKWLHYYANKCD